MKKLLRFILPTILVAALMIPLFPVQIIYAATAPEVTADAPSNITETSMRLNFTVDSTGGENPNIYVVWRQTEHYDYGEKRDDDLTELLAYWEHSEDEGTKGTGSYYVDINNLQASQVIWKVIASNSGGVAYDDGDPTYPTMPVATDSFIPTSNVNLKLRGGDIATQRIAQIFLTTSAYNLYAVALTNIGYYYGDVTVTIKAVDENYKPTGAALATLTTPATYVPQSKNWYYFETPLALNDATEYALIVESGYDGVSWHNFKGRKTSELYADGQLWEAPVGSETWTAYTDGGEDCDLIFELFDGDALRRSHVKTDYPVDSDVTETIANLGGLVYYLYDYDTVVTFQWGTTDAYGSETSSTTLYNADNSVGTSITKEITGLSAATEYHYRAKAVNTEGTSYGADVEFWTPDYSEEGNTIQTGLDVGAGLLANQRNSFYAQGRYWAFLSYNGYISYTSSLDGSIWAEPAIANANFGNPDSQMCVAFDGEHVHFVSGREDYKLGYRMGTPNANGTITWAAAFAEVIGSATSDCLYTTPYITTDVNGYPWVFTGRCHAGQEDELQIFTSTTKDGTWTEADGFPKDPFYHNWQRGIAVPLSNGNVYFIGSKRGSSDFVYNGGEVLKGVLWNGSTLGSVEDVTTTDMDYVGDVLGAPFALFSAVAFGNDVHLVFTSISNQIKYVKRSYATGTWSSEELLQSNVARRTAPVLSVHDADGKLFCFWIGTPDDHTIYYKVRSVAGIWDTSPTAWKFENCIGNVAAINTWQHSVEGLAGVVYKSSQTTEVGFRHWLDTTQELKFAVLETGFAVSTDTPADVTQVSSTLQGHLVHDGDEICSVRFQWGTTTSYGTDTTWQPGKETGAVFNQPISGLTADTTYHYRAQAKHADGVTVSGVDIAFATLSIGLPTITTETATGVGETGATLQGTLTSLGDYSPVYVSFQYGLTTSYGSTTIEETKTATGSFNTGISGLTTDTVYHYQARVRYNTSYAYGSDATFTTTGLGLLPPTNFTATRGDTTIALAWVKASGATNTMVRRSTTAFPTSISSGIQVYFGTGTGYTDNGLSNTQGYYYSVWSEYNGGYSASYATVYSPPAGTGTGILPPPDTLNIWSVEIYESYFATGDQLICLMYNLSYSSGEPTQDVRDFFAIEVWDGSTLVARVPVMAWGERPGSVYLSPTIALTWEQAFTLKVRGLASQWEVIPEAIYNVQSFNWTWSRSDFTDVLRSWCLNTAQAVDSSWVNATATGSALSDVACQIYNKAIPSLSAKVTGVCSSGSGFIDPEKRTHDPEYQGELNLDNAGDYVEGLFDEGANMFGMTGLNFGSMAFIILAVIAMVVVGFFTRSTAFSLTSATVVLGIGVWIGVVTLAWVMVVGGVLVLYMLYKLVVVGV